MYKLGWFSTGRGMGSRGLLKAVHDSIEAGEIKAKIEFVFCSRERGETEATDGFLDMVEGYGIPLVTFSYQKFKSQLKPSLSQATETLPEWRLLYDREVMARLKGYAPEVCVLAGYMLIAGREMCRKYDMINLHPAAPGGPTGTWQEVIWELIRQGAAETGAMMHLVTPELDRGPVVSYGTFPIRGGPYDKLWKEMEGRSVEEVKRTEGEENGLFKLIRERGAARELPLIIATIKAFSEGKVRITADKKVVDGEGKAINGYDLTGETEGRV
jgi:folate-dependent phosphoribosylglycinamide formyltransferase PurN